MQFEKHLFISYAHLDNLPLSEQQQGWVTKFHNSLSAMLSMRLGRKAEIWRDVKLAGNDIFGDEILDQFPKTALLVSVLTPRYVESEWCTREAREFAKQAQANGGLVVDNKSRILKIVKVPTDSEAPLPDVMKLSLGYPFYVLDEQQTPLELDSLYGQEFAEKYNVKVAKLAFDIAQLIKTMEKQQQAASSGTSASSTKPTVYLAECSYDRREAREAIEAELKLHGYEVLPDSKLPTEEEGYIAEVQKLLSRCELSVHLVGAKYGVVPDGPSDKSVGVLQNELAIARSQQAALARLIWLPEGTSSASLPQQQFIDAMLKDAAQQAGADLITGDLASFKSAIHFALKKIEAAAEAAAAHAKAAAAAASSGTAGSMAATPAETATKLIYILCDERDRKATLPLRKLLKQKNIDSQIPAFEGDAANVRQAHQETLANCDGFIIFYGAGNEAWKRSVDTDLRKAPAYRNGKPILVGYTYLAAPATADKTDLIDLEEPNVINGLDEFSDTLLEPLLKQLGAGAP
jgi:hypothetical protein